MLVHASACICKHITYIHTLSPGNERATNNIWSVFVCTTVLDDDTTVSCATLHALTQCASNVPIVLYSQHHITSHHITSHHITSHHTTSHHITSHHITSHHITSHHITSHHITSHHITSHHIISHHITSHQVTVNLKKVTQRLSDNFKSRDASASKKTTSSFSGVVA